VPLRYRVLAQSRALSTESTKQPSEKGEEVTASSTSSAGKEEKNSSPLKTIEEPLKGNSSGGEEEAERRSPFGMTRELLLIGVSLAVAWMLLSEIKDALYKVAYAKHLEKEVPFFKDVNDRFKIPNWLSFLNGMSREESELARRFSEWASAAPGLAVIFYFALSKPVDLLFGKRTTPIKWMPSGSARFSLIGLSLLALFMTSYQLYLANSNSNSGDPSKGPVKQYTADFVDACLLTPVLQELLFRQLLFRRMVAATGRTLPALIFSSLAFSVACLFDRILPIRELISSPRMKLEETLLRDAPQNSLQFELKSRALDAVARRDWKGVFKVGEENYATYPGKSLLGVKKEQWERLASPTTKDWERTAAMKEIKITWRDYEKNSEKVESTLGALKSSTARKAAEYVRKEKTDLENGRASMLAGFEEERQAQREFFARLGRSLYTTAPDGSPTLISIFRSFGAYGPSGVVFGATYLLSGGRLAVPVIAHVAQSSLLFDADKRVLQGAPS